MSGLVRTIMLLGVGVLIAGALLLMRQHEPERILVSPSPLLGTPPSSKLLGSSSLSHGGPGTASKARTFATDKLDPIKTGQRVTLIENRQRPPASSGSDQDRLNSADGGIEVEVMNVEARSTANGHIQQFFEVQFSDGRRAWVGQEFIGQLVWSAELADSNR
ncbi:MAG: hypothetical protein ACT4OO_11120 [Nitrospiraceae bacterium]